MNNDLDNSLNKINKPKKNDYCQELKNIEYKTMLLNGTSLISDKTNKDNNIEKITNFLDNESDANKKEPWIRLDKTQKIKKINIYINSLSIKYNLSNEEIKNLQQYLLRYLERKNLTKAKDVNYNKETGIIQNIPNLFFNDTTRTFYFKKDDKHISTVKSLPPDKKNKIKTLKIHDE
tara:strand:+ start:291 stop:821 length:531 start_codon:yes stop_codon:yes gene_type:complete